MGRSTGNRRRVATFPGRLTCNEQRALAGFIMFACRARSELAYELLQLLGQKASLPTKVRSAISVEIFSLSALQMEDVCQWLVALRDLPLTESILDAVKNTSLNDNDRIRLVTWLNTASSRDILNSLAGTKAWAQLDLSSADIAKGVITAGLSEIIQPKAGLRPAFPMHVWEAIKHGYIAVCGLDPRARMVSILTQGAGVRDTNGNIAIFQVPVDVKYIRRTVNRMDALAKAFSWLMGIVYKSRYLKWPKGPPRHLS